MMFIRGREYVPLPERLPHRHTASMATKLRLTAAMVGCILLFAACGKPEPTPAEQAATEQIRLTVLALEVFRLHTGAYPPTDPGLAWLRTAPPEATFSGAWNGPYLTEQTPVTDPWGRELTYKLDEDGIHYDLRSLGADSESDTDDLVAKELMPRLHDEIGRIPPRESSPAPKP